MLQGDQIQRAPAAAAVSVVNLRIRIRSFARRSTFKITQDWGIHLPSFIGLPRLLMARQSRHSPVHRLVPNAGLLVYRPLGRAR